MVFRSSVGALFVLLGLIISSYWTSSTLPAEPGASDA